MCQHGTINSDTICRRNNRAQRRGGVRPLHMIPDMMMMDYLPVMTTAASSATTVLTSSSSSLSSPLGSDLLLAFSDQGSNLAGLFFQASLLPYLLFLYFLSFRANRIPALGNYGFQYVLLFVLSTIPSGIISKSIYGYSLADTDWLHGGAETLLTVANILIVGKEICCGGIENSPVFELNPIRLLSLTLNPLLQNSIVSILASIIFDIST
jgi:Protein of unknown function (DUF3593)